MPTSAPALFGFAAMLSSPFFCCLRSDIIRTSVPQSRLILSVILHSMQLSFPYVVYCSAYHAGVLLPLLLCLHFTRVPDTNLKKCLGWHFELERHGSGLSESTEQIRLFVVGRAEACVAPMPLIGVPTSIVQWGEVSGI